MPHTVQWLTDGWVETAYQPDLWTAQDFAREKAQDNPGTLVEIYSITGDRVSEYCA